MFDHFRLHFFGAHHVTISDISALIKDYMKDGSTVTMDDITKLIDAYRHQ